jgi:manganese-dependent inorganic pyrophosphatase
VQTIVIGHRNPDMDSVCSALGYARLKRDLGWPDVVAARAGNLNPRIQFVLDKFGAEAPVFLSDVTPQVRDVMTREVVSARADHSIAQALRAIEQRHLRGLPVVDEANHCLGLLSADKIVHQLFPPLSALEGARVVRAALTDIVQTFEGVVVAGGCNGGVQDYVLMVAAMKTETFAQRLRRQSPKQVVLLVGDRDDIQNRAIDEGVRALIITGGIPVAREIQERAEAEGVTLIRSRHDTATTVLLARGAVRASQMLEREFTSLEPDLPLGAARKKVGPSVASIFPVLDPERRLIGILSKSDFLKTVPRQLILVDHNELSQAVHGADKLPIVEVIDHHRMGGFSSDTPIHFWNNPVGSTCTIVALLYQQHDIPISPGTAGLLMGGLIADTLNLSSPTATETDRIILETLGRVAGVDAASLARQIFNVGSPLLTLRPQDVVTSDAKEYEEAGVRFSVAQIEELGFGPFYDKQRDLSQALDEYCQSRRLFFSALLVTDVNTQNSLLLVSGSEEFRQEIDYPVAGPGLWQLNGVVSRKKQLLPYLVHRLHETRAASAPPPVGDG